MTKKVLVKIPDITKEQIDKAIDVLDDLILNSGEFTAEEEKALRILTVAAYAALGE